VAPSRQYVPVGFRVVGRDTPFQRRVIRMVRRIPAGRVASYGQVAAWVGQPAAARAVGGTLARSPAQTPAHRVVTASGRLVPGWEHEQAQLLRAEGVRVRDGRVAEPQPWWDGPSRTSR
jgi:methylated-DNA-protein-cysteine methyltransferase related protein